MTEKKLYLTLQSVLCVLLVILLESWAITKSSGVLNEAATV